MKGTRKDRYEAGTEMDGAGIRHGRDPREMTVEDLHLSGHTDQPLMKVIRAKCLDCVCGSLAEVRDCASVDCANWPYRMGKNPFRTKILTDDQRAALADRLKKSRLR